MNTRATDDDRVLAELAADTEAAADRLFRAEDRDELRRSLREALSNLYTWREYERKQVTPTIKGFQGREYRADVLEALVSWRGVEVHDLAELVDLDVHPLLSGQLITGPNLVLGKQPHFRVLTADEIAALGNRRGRDAYPTLSGQPVTQFIRDAARYLAELGAARQS